MFYERGLQQTYPLTEKLVEMFIACESFVPFADLHHLSYAIRKITHTKFRYLPFHLESASIASENVSKTASTKANPKQFSR